MNTIFIVVLVALVSLVALVASRRISFKKQLELFDVVPAETEQIWIGTTTLHGETVRVCEGSKQYVWDTLKTFKRLNPAATGWRIHPARSKRS